MAGMTVDPAIAREAWRLAEPLHSMIFFVPEAQERYDALGVPATAGYFASRGGVFGAVGAGPVIATFYNFNPRIVARALPAVWEHVTPEAVLAARIDAADAALTRGLGETIESPELAEAAVLARRAAESATAYAAGRPLFAATAAQPWPDAPHLVLWHAQGVLREFRGDAHVAALLVAGVNGLQAIILHAASGQIDATFLRVSRGWSRDEWAAETEVLRARGLVEGDPAAGGEVTLTEQGRALRAGIEADTDRLAVPAYAILGDHGAARLAELARPMSRTLVKAGFLTGGLPARK
jgi:hypothetical protein